MQNENILNFLKECTKRNISNDDFAYLSRWYLEDYNTITEGIYFGKVERFLDDRFFDNNNVIDIVLKNYVK